MFRLLVIILMACAISCSSAPEVDVPGDIASLENLTVYSADTEPAYELSLTPEATFGDTDDLFLGGSLRSVTDKDGRVILADLQQTQLHLYNADGSYNRPIGREGEGPGEFREIGTMQVDDSYLHLMDRRLNRITRYDLETFEVAGEINITLEEEEGSANLRYPQSFHLAGPESYLMVLSRSFSAGAEFEGRRTIDGIMMSWVNDSLSNNEIFSFDASETLIERDGGSIMVMFVDYKRSSVIDYENKQLIHCWNEHFLFKFYDKEGEYLRSIYYPYQNMPLDRDNVLQRNEEYDEQWLSMIRNDDMPDVWPSWETFTVDDEGRIWVERLVDDVDNTVLHILSTTGELLATAPWHTDRSIQSIKNGFIYTSEENDMGLREIVKYAISLE